MKLVQRPLAHCLLEFLRPQGLAGSGELTQQTGYSGTEMTSRAHEVLTNCQYDLTDTFAHTKLPDSP